TTDSTQTAATTGANALTGRGCTAVKIRAKNHNGGSTSMHARRRVRGRSLNLAITKLWPETTKLRTMVTVCLPYTQRQKPTQHSVNEPQKAAAPKRYFPRGRWIQCAPPR